MSRRPFGWDLPPGVSNADIDRYCDDGEEEDDRSIFANEGSALRVATPDNPRNLPCPNCDEPNRLTPADRQLGYQCDRCADAAEGLRPAY